MVWWGLGFRILGFSGLGCEVLSAFCKLRNCLKLNVAGVVVSL